MADRSNVPEFIVDMWHSVAAGIEEDPEDGLDYTPAEAAILEAAVIDARLAFAKEWGNHWGVAAQVLAAEVQRLRVHAWGLEELDAYHQAKAAEREKDLLGHMEAMATVLEQGRTALSRIWDKFLAAVQSKHGPLSSIWGLEETKQRITENAMVEYQLNGETTLMIFEAGLAAAIAVTPYYHSKETREQEARESMENVVGDGLYQSGYSMLAKLCERVGETTVLLALVGMVNKARKEALDHD